jgi:hypothetical protein
LVVLLAICVVLAGFAQAQPAPATEEDRLERDFTGPLSTLPQLVIRDSYTPANFGTGLETNQFLIRPLIPRIPPRTFLPFTQLIRPTFALAMS